VLPFVLSRDTSKPDKSGGSFASDRLWGTFRLLDWLRGLRETLWLDEPGQTIGRPHMTPYAEAYLRGSDWPSTKGRTGEPE